MSICHMIRNHHDSETMFLEGKDAKQYNSYVGILNLSIHHCKECQNCLADIEWQRSCDMILDVLDLDLEHLEVIIGEVKDLLYQLSEEF